MYLVKDTPILKNKKLFKVGEVFPYSENDKHLLWDLTDLSAEATAKEEVEETEFEIVPDTEKDVPNDEAKKTFAPKKKAPAKKSSVAKKKIKSVV
jgi:hypothetical protein